MSVTLADLTTAAAIDSDKENDASVTAAWPVWENQGIEALWKVLIANFRDLYYSTFDFPLTGTPTGSILTLSSSVPTFRIIIGLDLDPATSNRRRVKSRPFVNRNDDAWGRMWLNIPWAMDREYMLQGDKLILTPYEVAAGNYRLHFRKTPTLNTGGAGDTIDPEMEPYREFISSFMARKALAKEESDTTPVDQRLAEIKQEIIEAGSRNEADPFVIADVEDCVSWGRGG